MRIAIFHNLPSGGAKRALSETARRLSERHVLDIYSLSTADHEFCDLRPYARRYRIFDYEPLPLFRSPLGRLNQIQRWRDLSRLASLGKQVAVAIDHVGYDVVYLHPSLWTQAPTLLSHLSSPSVYHIQEPLRSVHEAAIGRPYLNSGWRQKVDRFDPLIGLYKRRVISVDRACTQRATRLLANSRFTAENAYRIYRRRPEVCYFGVDCDHFRPIASVERGDFVLSVGVLKPHKGYDFLVEALAEIPRSYRPTLRIIANAEDPRERTFVSKFAEERDVEVEIETMVDQQTLNLRYNQAALLVYSPVREPFGLVPLEAMACGTPVIGVAEGGVRETIVDGETGYLTSRDPRQFAERIQHLLSNPSLRDQMGEAGREYVSADWTWQKAVQRIEHFLALPQTHNTPSEQRLGPDLQGRS